MKDIEDVKQINDNDLADKIAEAMGWEFDDHPAISGTGQWMAEYDYGVYYKEDGTFQERLYWEPCNDWDQAREVQAKVIEVDGVEYVNNLYSVRYGFKRPDDHRLDELNVTHLLQATPRQISEAAYITIQEVNREKI